MLFVLGNPYAACDAEYTSNIYKHKNRIKMSFWISINLMIRSLSNLSWISDNKFNMEIPKKP